VRRSGVSAVEKHLIGVTKRRGWREHALPLLVLVGFVSLGVFFFIFLPPLLVPTQRGLTAAARLKAENDVRATGVQLLAGAVLA
jgi:hypothetical protein